MQFCESPPADLAVRGLRPPGLWPRMALPRLTLPTWLSIVSALQPHDIPRLGVIQPMDGGQPLVALPLPLPMGWVEKPTVFYGRRRNRM